MEQKFSHYVLDKDLPESVVEGTEVLALCGDIGLPFFKRGKEPSPLCPKCKELYEKLST